MPFRLYALLFLFSLILLSSESAAHETTPTKRASIGLNYNRQWTLETSDWALRQVNLEYIGKSQNPLYGTLHLKGGIGSLQETDEYSSRIHRFRVLNIHAGIAIGMNKRLYGWRFSNLLGVSCFGDHLAVKTEHLLSLTSGQLLNKWELSLNVLVYATSRHTIPGISYCNMSIGYRL